MPKPTNTLVVVTLSLLSAFSFGCGPEENDGNNGQSPDQPETCTPYDPTQAGDTIDGQWTGSDSAPTHSITVPDNPGGGYVTWTLEPGADGLPSIDVIAQTDDARIYGDSGGAGDTVSGSFAAAPGETFVFDVGQHVAAPAEDYPIDYTLTWEWTDVIDCYEPNDAQAEAVAVPYGEPIEAYLFAGHADSNVPDIDEEMSDWYEVEVPAGEVTVELTALPDYAVKLDLYDASGTQLAQTSNSGSNGQPFALEGGELQAGTYYIEVHHWISPTDEFSVLETPVPDFWTTPYTLQVSVATQ